MLSVCLSRVPVNLKFTMLVNSFCSQFLISASDISPPMAVCVLLSLNLMVSSVGSSLWGMPLCVKLS